MINPFKSLLELWTYRDLVLVFAGRDIKVRYKQTLLGLVWVIIQPLASAGMLGFIFGNIFQSPSKDNSYMVFVFSGMVLWQFFSRGIAEGAVSLSNNQSLITKVFFPRIILPFSPIMSATFDFFILFSLMMIYILLFKKILLSFLFVPLIVAGIIVLIFGINLIISALDALYRDIRHSIPFIVSLIFFSCPIFYPVSIVGPKHLALIKLNPIALYIELFRWSLYRGDTFVGYYEVFYMFGVSLLILLIGLTFFRLVERNIVDII